MVVEVQALTFSGFRGLLGNPVLTGADKALVRNALLKEKFDTCDPTHSTVIWWGRKSRM